MDDLRQATRDFYRRALEKSGLSAYRLAKKANIASTTITRPLSDKNYNFVPRLETITKIANAAGLEVPDFINSSETMDIIPVERSIPVLGVVRAGSWEAIPDDPEPEDWLYMDVPEYTGARLFALRVSGRSMDEMYPDGSFVIAVPPAEAGLRVGDCVVVRRMDATGRAETTLKIISKAKDGAIVLEPRSSDKSLTPMILSINADSDEGIEIIGVIVSSYKKAARGTGPLLRAP